MIPDRFNLVKKVHFKDDLTPQRIPVSLFQLLRSTQASSCSYGEQSENLLENSGDRHAARCMNYI